MSIMNSIWPDPEERVAVVCSSIKDVNKINTCQYNTYTDVAAVRLRTLFLGSLVAATGALYLLLRKKK